MKSKWVWLVGGAVVFIYVFVVNKPKTVQTVNASTQNTGEQRNLDYLAQAVTNMSVQVYNADHPASASTAQPAPSPVLGYQGGENHVGYKPSWSTGPLGVPY